MSGTRVEDFNLLFYSDLPYDKLSKIFIKKLHQHSGLKNQFRLCKINIDNKKFNPILPKLIKQSICDFPQRIPILAISGCDKLIYAREALSWLDNSLLSGGKSDDIKSMALHDDDLISSYSKIENYNDFDNFNTGFTRGTPVNMLSLDRNQISTKMDPLKIKTYEDVNFEDTDKLFKNIKQERDNEFKQFNNNNGNNNMNFQDILSNNRNNIIPPYPSRNFQGNLPNISYR